MGPFNFASPEILYKDSVKLRLQIKETLHIKEQLIEPDLGNMGKRVLGGTLRFTLQAIHCCASQYSSK